MLADGRFVEWQPSSPGGGSPESAQLDVRRLFGSTRHVCAASGQRRSVNIVRTFEQTAPTKTHASIPRKFVLLKSAYEFFQKNSMTGLFQIPIAG
jgi:hypothetical protein